jgi:hypothetical protein
MRSKPFRGELHDWAILRHREGLYSIFGRPVGHPHFVNWIRTSPVVSLVGNLVETQNSFYSLIGEENDFETAFARSQGRQG